MQVLGAETAQVPVPVIVGQKDDEVGVGHGMAL
jgi:ribosomal protein S5